MKLMELHLQNFMGVKNFTFEPTGQNAAIFAANGIGKTTIGSAFSWLLFGTDQQNRADYKVKTEDANGEVLHGLEHSVEAVLLAQPRVTLKRTYLERWTKKRGSAEKLFEGHETEYHIDGVPVSKREYDDRIASICDKETFKLLTNPRYFQSLKTDDRRRMLLAVCGDISDADVIASDVKLARLPEVLGPRSFDDHKKVATERKRRINDELKGIPNRIDEVELGLPDVSGLDQTLLNGQLIKATGEKQSREKELARIQAGGEVAEKRKALAQVETRIIEIKNAHQAAANAGSNAKTQELNEARTELDRATAGIASQESLIAGNVGEIQRYESRADTLRDQWQVESDKEFTSEGKCPTCKQDLPAAEIEAARAAYNRAKSDRLEQITIDGKALTKQISDIEAVNVARAEEIEKHKTQAEQIQQQIDALEAEAASAKTAPAPVETNPDYQGALAQKAEIESAVLGLEQDIRGTVAAAEQAILSLDTQISAINADLAKFAQRKSGEERIEELKAQEKELATEYEQLEADLFLLEEFTRAKCALLTDKINGQFELARFRLFENQVNGGVKDICEVTHLWNPPSNAQEINTGLDIIRTFGAHYGVCPPIIVDNAESINQLIDMPGQIIRLVVSEDKKLRVEVSEAERIKEIA